ncbi:HDOD domain-containing protein [Alteromonas oceanisediminis]|uniref:HDOD domain-containing protein n=1 Tax=Alteromonas oceanisediminis TaxID=2836180 RepID=UPI001BDA389D|nr:HDOD domain-containing protein [Alteromonas oceanisediminis]MBT0587254.1 HDOD domain-containing protein [Alteromonas oceanisediminis]
MNVVEYAREAAEVFVLPDTVTTLKSVIDDDQTTVDDIATLIAFDPTLSAQLLKLANSALYKFPNRIDTISKAIQIIGTKALYDLAVSYGVAKTFALVPANVIDLDKFWEQSLSCALLAKHLAEVKRVREPERLFVAGLLHNIGELAMVQTHPEMAAQCTSITSSTTPRVMQQSLCGFTFAQLSAEIMTAWNLPDSLIDLVTGVHHKLFPADSVDLQIIQLAYVLSLDNINQDVYDSYANLQPFLHESLSLKREDMETALDTTNLQCINVISLFNPSAFLVY